MTILKGLILIVFTVLTQASWIPLAYGGNDVPFCKDPDGANIPKLQSLGLKKKATPKDYLPYLNSLILATSIQDTTKPNSIPPSDGCFSVTESAYGQENKPDSVMLIEQGCAEVKNLQGKVMYTKAAKVMVNCAQALENGICQDGACVVKKTPFSIIAMFQGMWGKVFSFFIFPQNPENCQDGDSKKFQPKGEVLKDQASLTTPGVVTFEDSAGKTQTLKDACEKIYDAFLAHEEITEAVCYIEQNKVIHGTLDTTCDKGSVCTEEALDPDKPGSLKVVGAHCIPGKYGQPDWDGDGVIMGDNCYAVANPDKKDSDGDGKGDACDMDDGDKDGVIDIKDNCPTVANQEQNNSDNNPAGDLCQDTDGDGWLDLQDNCPSVENKDQLDFNMNSVGDVCDDPAVLSEVGTETPKDFSAGHRLSAGMNHTCALFDKKPYCWGSSQWLQVGLGSYEKGEDFKVVVPKPVFDDAPYLGITAGKIHTCGWIDASPFSNKGKIKCWGINKMNLSSEEEADGVLGIDPNYTGITGVPLQLTNFANGSDDEALQVSANQNATCALVKWHSNVICQATGKFCEFQTPWCWGGSFGKNPTQYPLLGTGKKVTSLATGKNHMCGIVASEKWGEAWCLGKSDSGQLGDGVTNSATFDPTPKKVALPYVTGQAAASSNVIKVVSGTAHSCALMQRGINLAQLKTRLYCWGDNQQGQIPTKDGAGKTFYNTPQDLTEELTYETSPADEGPEVLDVATFADATCAVVMPKGTTKPKVKCWGGPNYQEIVSIFTGNKGDDYNAENILSLSVGGEHACTLHPNNKIYCWGKNQYGQLGWPVLNDSMTIPQQVNSPKD